MTVDQQIARVFASARFQDRVKEYLVGAPELKHESIVMTQLRIGLGLEGRTCRREVPDRTRGFRHDLHVAPDTFIEAKYHYEGDLASIDRALRKAATDIQFRAKVLRPETRKTAARDLITQATRQNGAHWLLWMVLVRPLSEPGRYGLPHLIGNYYSKESIDLDAGVERAVLLMDGVVATFTALRGSSCATQWLPQVKTAQGILLAKLVQLRSRLSNADEGIHDADSSYEPMEALRTK